MKRWLVFAVFVGFCSAITSPLLAQDIETFISNYTGVNGPGYMQPLANSFTANLNSGIYQGAAIPKSQFYIRGNLVGMLATTSDDNKTFTATTEDPFTPEQTATAPTVFGDTEPVTVEGEGGTAFVFPGGFAIDKVPFLVPQVAIGGIMGTEVTFRYFQVSLDDALDNIKLFGFGARHNISQYLNDPPLDLAFGFFFQTFEVTDIVEAHTTYYGVQGSYTTGRGIANLTLYTGLGAETSNLTIAYSIDNDTSIEFDMDSDNSFRFTLGAAIDLRFIRAFIDYNFASRSALSLGLGFGSM